LGHAVAADRVLGRVGRLKGSVEVRLEGHRVEVELFVGSCRAMKDR